MAVFLAVAGNIGSGKTTLTRRLVTRLGFTGLYESTVDNPYLADFYGDMRRYALPLQLRFLAQRVMDTRQAQQDGTAVIQDRTCYEDALIFAANLHDRGAMDGRDFDTYRMVAGQLLHDLDPPDLLVYLRRPAEGCRQNIQKRGRDYEQSMPPGYLEDLSGRYDAWFDEYPHGPKMLVNAEEHDFLNSESDLDKLVERIGASLPQPLLPFSDV